MHVPERSAEFRNPVYGYESFEGNKLEVRRTRTSGCDAMQLQGSATFV
jgi:hypothetical protein